MLVQVQRKENEDMREREAMCWSVQGGDQYYTGENRVTPANVFCYILSDLEHLSGILIRSDPLLADVITANINSVKARDATCELLR